MGLIMFTEKHTHPIDLDGKTESEVLINPAHITAIMNTGNPSYTHIGVSGFNERVCVKGSFNEVTKRISEVAEIKA